MLYIDNLESFLEHQREYVLQLEEVVQDSLKDLGYQVLLNCSNDRSFNGVRLKNSVTFSKKSKNSIQTKTNLKHASYLNDGTAPHVIKPRRKKALRFVSSSGNIVFAKKVNHPGTKATHWFDNANKNAFNQITAELAGKIDEIKF